MSKVVGLTGQSGAGKTTVSDAFAAKGFAVINCDITARSVTRDGSDCNKELAGIFPKCFDENLRLDRKKLAEEVFADREKLEKLDNTIYPYIIKAIKDEIGILSERYDYILLDAPTLFEAGADKLCDIIVSVTAEENIRFERIKKRDRIDDELIKKRFSSQHTAEFFRENSDYVIENNSDISVTSETAAEIIDKIKGSN